MKSLINSSSRILSSFEVSNSISISAFPSSKRRPSRSLNVKSSFSLFSQRNLQEKRSFLRSKLYSTAEIYVLRRFPEADECKCRSFLFNKLNRPFPFLKFLKVKFFDSKTLKVPRQSCFHQRKTSRGEYY